MDNSAQEIVDKASTEPTAADYAKANFYPELFKEEAEKLSDAANVAGLTVTDDTIFKEVCRNLRKNGS